MANVLNRIGNAIKSAIGYGPGWVKTHIWGIGVQEVYSPIEQQTAISKGFNANTAVYSIVKKYAKKASSIERYLENKKDDKPLEKHPLNLLLQRPNPRQSQAAFFKTVFACYKLFGECFIWLNRGDATMGVDENGELYERTPQQYIKVPVTEMFVIPANHIVVIPDRNDPNDIIGYQLANRPDIKIRKEDMIHWMDLNLDWDEFSRPQLRGMTPLKPGFKTLTADNSLIDSMVRMAQGDGAKGAAVNKTVGMKMSPEQQAQVKRVFDEKINNKDIKNTIAALEGDWQYLNFGLTAVDMDTLAARNFIYKELCFLLDVPFALFDTEITYANQNEAKKGWISDSIKPDCKELDEELQRVLFPAFGLSYETAQICTDFDELPEMQEDKEKMIDRLNKTPMTGNERREEMGYEKSTAEGMEEVTCSEDMKPIEQADAELDAAMSDIQTMRNAANGTANTGNGDE